MVGAAWTVLVTVEEIVPPGALQRGGRSSILTRNRVSAVAPVAGGAWPTSCLPYYVTDYAALKDAFTPGRPLGDAFRLPASGVPSFVRDAARIGADRLAMASPAAHLQCLP